MYDSEVMCRQKVDTPWSIHRDFTHAKKKSNSITHWDYYKPSNRDLPITNCLIQSNSYYLLPITNYRFVNFEQRAWWYGAQFCQKAGKNL